MTNNKPKYPNWTELLAREAGIRKALVLHGDIFDVYQSPKDSSKYVPLWPVVSTTLRSKGFSDIILWDSHVGVMNVKPKRWAELQKNMMAGSFGNNESSENESEYDMGEINSDDAPQTVGGENPPDIDDFLAIVHFYLTHETDKRIAFIIDWSHYVFQAGAALSEADRKRLLVLGKSINNAPLGFSSVEEMEKPSNILVLITSNIGSIPPAFYQGSVCVKDIAVTPPTRTEREDFLKKESMKLNLQENPMFVKSKSADFVDSTDGLNIRDLIQISRLSRQTDEPLTADKIINLYRYGEQKSPWEDLNKDKLSNFGEKIAERVKGQNFAIEKLEKVIIRAYVGLSGVQHSKKQKSPKGTLFFVGPTGVGKTELAKSLAEFLFGDEDACIRFDMSEFSNEFSDQRLVGAPPGYVGYEQGGELTNAIKRRPFAVLLFDEIEKAHQKILDKFLQILEDGRLTDGKGETVSFAESVIIFTSNIGASEIKLSDANGNYKDEDAIRSEFISKVREHFSTVLRRPELLNRIGDNIVPFNFITNDDFLVAIIKSKITPLKNALKEKYGVRDVIITNEAESFSYIASNLDKTMGGRGALNELVAKLFDPLAVFLFKYSGETAGKTLLITKNESAFEFEFMD